MTGKILSFCIPLLDTLAFCVSYDIFLNFFSKHHNVYHCYVAM
jgi:hypothetical protein